LLLPLNRISNTAAADFSPLRRSFATDYYMPLRRRRAAHADTPFFID